GVKYDAEGVGAVLNIVTAQISGDGTMTTVSLNGGYPTTYGGSLYLSSKIKKFGATANISSYNSNMDMTAILDQIQDNTLLLREDSRQKRTVNGLQGSLLLSYEINNKNLITWTTSLSNIHTEGDTGSDIIKPSSGTSTKKYNQDKIKIDAINTSLDYQLSTSRAGELLTLSYRYAITPNFLYNLREVPSTSQAERMKSKEAMNEHTGQIDYTLPIGKHKAEVGTKYIYRNNETSPLYEIYDSRKGWIPGSHYATEYAKNGLLHKNIILAGYASYNYSDGPFSLTAGVRAEQNRVEAQYKNLLTSRIDRSFTDVIPQVSLGYVPSPTLQTRIGYKEMVVRPSLRQLSPFETNISDILYHKGNPNLETSRVRNFNFSITHFGAKYMINAGLDYSLQYNNIESVIYRAKESDVLISTFGNLKDPSHNIRANIYTTYNPKNWLRLSAFANISQTKRGATESVEVNGVSHSLNLPEFSSLGLSGNINGTFIMPKNFIFNANLYYMGRQKMLQTEINDYLIHSFSLSKRFMNDKLTLTLSAVSPFTNNLNLEVVSKVGSLTNLNRIQVPIRRVTLGLTFKFGSMKGQVKKTSKTIVNDDLSKATSSTELPSTGM
ncbi:MAG: outer membrane beta-barrel family protein, partial [Porphyromonas sp.]|nr:outer membrane beta-barrel family protein [Porphyromonas sp.]